MTKASATLTSWDEVPLQPMRGNITRRFVHSDRMMVAQVNFAAGDSVPAHRHDNEQYTYVISGALHFLFGDDQDQEMGTSNNPSTFWV